MAYRCEICGRGTAVGRQISHSHRVSARTFRPNLRKIRIQVNGGVRRAWVCVRCISAGKVRKA